MLVSDAWKDYLDAHEKQWSDRHMADHCYLSKKAEGKSPAGVLRPLLDKKMAEINLETLLKWADTATNAKKISKANQGRLLALRNGYIRFRAFWRWCHGRPQDYGSLADPSMFSHSDLKAYLPPSKAKDDVLEKGQLEAWFREVRAIDNETISAYLQILFLIGCRRNELAELKWRDVDFKWGSIRLKDKVEKEGRVVPLTEYCRRLLLELKQENDSKPRDNQSEWVFRQQRRKMVTSSSRGSHIKPALEVAGIPRNLSLHGLRRSFGSLAEWIEAPVGIVAQIQGHKPSATAKKHYRRRPLDLLKMWHQKFEDWILEQAKVEFGSERLKIVD